MNLIIVVATEQEIAPFIAEFDSNMRGSVFEVNGVNAEVLITGVGIANTAYSLGKRLVSGKTPIDLLINVGICGSFRPELTTGTVVNVTQDCLAYFGVEDGDAFITAHELNLVNENETVFKNSELFESSLISNLPKVKGITVNTGHGNKESIMRTAELYSPDVESMEGAAFMMACTKEDLPYFQLRAISNPIEQRNTDNWNIPLALKNLNDTLISLIDSFVQHP